MANKNSNSQNRITKESIFTALMIIMEKKDFKEISITEITKKAGVSRMAFYRSYNQMEDIIINHLDEFLVEYSKQLLNHHECDVYETLCLYFAYFRENKKLITNLISSNLTNLLLKKCCEFFKSLFKNSTCNKGYPIETEKYIIDFIAGGNYKVLIEWAISGMEESDEYMAKFVCNLKIH